MGFVVGHWAPGRRFGVDLLCFLLFQKRREPFQMSLGFGLTMYLQRSSFKRASRSHAKTGLFGGLKIAVLFAWQLTFALYCWKLSSHAGKTLFLAEPGNLNSNSNEQK